MPDIPLIPAVTFRPFQGESDFPAMVDIFHAINRAGQVEGVMTLDRLANEYAHLNNCDRATDCSIPPWPPDGNLPKRPAATGKEHRRSGMLQAGGR